MSIVATIENVSEELEDKILSEVMVKKITEKSSFSKFGGAKPKEVIVRPYMMTENKVHLPFAWALNNIPGIKRRDREEFSVLKDGLKINKELREIQKEIKGDCMKALNKFGCHLISLYPGAGKCHGINTPIIMFDGSIKMIQDIKVGEKVMGDDATPRNVLSISRGREKLYKIKQELGDDYVVNESHILCLKFMDYVYDIPLVEFMKKPKIIQDFYVGYKVFIDFPKKTISPDQDDQRTKISVVPLGVGDYYGFVLDGNHRYLLGDFTVTHNTFFSLYLALKIGLKTLVICHRVGLMEQWMEEICDNIDGGGRCSIIEPHKKKKSNTDVDFMFVNAQNVSKIGEEVFRDCGLVIVDEIHSVVAETLSKCLCYLSPRYLIGLSATLYRPDGLDGLFDFYFGSENRTVKELYHPHIVYKIQTNIEYEEDSKTQWSSLITTQCSNVVRNEYILKIIRGFKDRHFMVLCQRVSQAEYIHSKLLLEGEKSSLYIGGTSGYDKESRVIVASISKGGVGFSFSKLDALILASDCISEDTDEYFVQLLARVMRREDVRPIVYDIVDNHHTLKKHFSVRKRTYLKVGGILKDFYKEHPDFGQL
jgi:hypothetical protein